MDSNSSGLVFGLGTEVARAPVLNRLNCGFEMLKKTSQAALTSLVDSAGVRQVWLGIERLKRQFQGESGYVAE